MTLEQLKIEIDQLVIDGKGKYLVYFKDGPMSYPVSCVLTDKIVTINIDIVVLKD